MAGNGVAHTGFGPRMAPRGWGPEGEEEGVSWAVGAAQIRPPKQHVWGSVVPCEVQDPHLAVTVCDSV